MIAILGAGNIATALALLLGKRVEAIALYSIEASIIQEVNKNHQNTKYLPGHLLPTTVFATDSIKEALHGAHFVIVALPSHAVAEVFSAASRYLEPDAIVVSITKGIDPETFYPLILQQIGIAPEEIQKRLVLLGGPAIATELALGQTTGMVIASRDKSAAEEVRLLFASTVIQTFLSEDMIGVGLASALKNAYAIAFGLCDGLEVSTNTKALIFSIALQEIADLVVAAGGQRETVFGIAGVGDLFVSGSSFHARNRKYGQKLVTSTTSNPQELGMTTVEGINTTHTAIELAQKWGLKTPLLETIGACLKCTHHFSLPFEKYLRGRN